MKCDLSIELLSGYLDGELDKKQKAEIEKHLKECEVCRKELEELRQLDEHVRIAEVEEPSREFIFNINHQFLYLLL
jgi:anti-sigma factor RsiW